MQTPFTIWFYFKSASPILTHNLAPEDPRLPLLLEDVRMVRHGSHVFIHLRSDFEWERAMEILQITSEKFHQATSAA